MPFEKEQILKAGGEWEMAEHCNKALAVLSASCVTKIDHADYIRSKISWQYAVLRQSLTYRIVDLTEGAMTSWSLEQCLPALVVGRSALETVALISDIETSMRKLIDAKDVGGLNDYAMKQLYSAKVDMFLLDPEFLAKSIMGAIDKLEKKIPAVRKYYDTLSEYAHPNAKGHHLFYCKLDQENGLSHFSTDTMGLKGTVKNIITACLGIIWAELSLKAMDEMIAEIVDLHEAYIDSQKK